MAGTVVPFHCFVEFRLGRRTADQHGVEPMTHPLAFAFVYTVVVCLVVPGMLRLFSANYEIIDVVMAAVLSALASMIPVVGGVLSLVVLVAVLNYRSGASLFPDIVVAVAVARLATIPVMLLLKLGRTAGA
jgi:Na+/H+ antiporter NhaA